MKNTSRKNEQNLINLSMFYALKNPVDEATSVDFLGANRPNVDIKEIPNGNIILTVLNSPEDGENGKNSNNDNPQNTLTVLK